MKEKIEINAVELVRGIRDRQAELLHDKSKEEIIKFFRKAGAAVRRESGIKYKNGRIKNRSFQNNGVQM